MVHCISLTADTAAALLGPCTALIAAEQCGQVWANEITSCSKKRHLN